MSHKTPLEEMWEEIEGFGLKRDLLDPHGDLAYDHVEEIYLSIKQKRIEDMQIRVLKERLEKEQMKQ